MGTPPYMPPEQWDGAHKASFGADVYAFGCILYELFCKRRLFVLDPKLRQARPELMRLEWERLHREAEPDHPNSLESLLSKAPHMDDDGFTEAVMMRLPPGRPSLRMRAIILITSTVASGGLVAAIPAARRLLAEICAGFASVSAATGSNLLVAGVVVALVVWGAIAATSSEA